MPRYTERAGSGRGKPSAIVHSDFLACFHSLPLKRSRFRKSSVIFKARIVPKLLVSHIRTAVPE